MDKPKILGQITPAAATVTDLYICPASVIGAVSSSLMVCNTQVIAGVFSVYLAKAGAVSSNDQLIYANATLIPEDTYIATIGITFEAGDVLRVSSSIANVNFHLMGLERT